MPRRREQPLEHRLLLTATFCLLAGGAVMVYSASSARTLLEGQGDGTLYLVKYLAYQHEPDESATELCFRVNETLDRARDAGIELLFQTQRQHLDRFWRDTDVHVEGAPLVEQAIRFNLFQLLQVSGGVAGYGIPAKGLTGRGYEGHYFWDTEIYVMPFLTYTAPNAARALIRHRYDMLDHARQRARQVGNRGARITAFDQTFTDQDGVGTRTGIRQ